MSEDFIPIPVREIKAETNLAFLVLLDDGSDEGREVWLPKSQIEDPSYLNVGDEDCEVCVRRWLVRQLDLDDE